MTCKALLPHVLVSASQRVMTPIRDVTGQSRMVNESLGRAGSTERRVIADALAASARRLQAATTVEQWRDIIKGHK